MARKGIKSKARGKWYLDEWMAARGMNGDQLAAKVGTSKSRISEMRNPGPETRYNQDVIETYAAALGIPALALLFQPEVWPLVELALKVPTKRRSKAKMNLQSFVDDDAPEPDKMAG